MELISESNRVFKLRHFINVSSMHKYIFRLAMIFFCFTNPGIFGQDTIIVTTDRSTELMQSQFRIGTTHVQSNWQNGNSVAVSRAKSNLENAPVKLQNIHLMGWGAGNPNPSPGVYSWGSLDSRIQLMRSMNAEMILTLCSAPGWMKTSGEDWDMEDRVKDEYFDEYAELCKQAALRYPDIKYFQVWNEFKGFWNKTAGAWDVVKYVEFYNVVYTAVRSVRPDAFIGGFYKGFSDEMTKGGVLTSYDLYMIDYWLENNAGADFISFDGSIHGWPHVAASEETLMKLSSCFGNVAAEIRKKTSLPIWVSEYYAANMVGDATFQAANHASAYYHSLINGTAVALHWDPVGYAPLITSTTNSSGGQTTLHYDVVSMFNKNFGSGRKLYQTSCSDPEYLEVLASATKTLLINNRSSLVNVNLDGVAISLNPYKVKLCDRTNNVVLTKGETTLLDQIVGPIDLSSPSAHWSSSNNSVISIDESRNLSAVSTGTAEITITIDEAGFTDVWTFPVRVQDLTQFTIRVDISKEIKPDWFNTMYFADSKITNWQFIAMKKESENIYYYTDTINDGTEIRPTFAFGAGWGTAESLPLCAQEGGSSRTQIITSSNNDFTFYWDEFDCEDEIDPAVLNADSTAYILFSKDNEQGTVAREVLGHGLIYDTEGDSLWSAPEGLLNKEVKALSTGILRYPGGVGTNYYHWNNPTGTYKDDNWNPGYNPSNNVDPQYWMSVDEYLSLCTQLGTTPLLGVNIESGLVYNREEEGINEAVALVNHVKSKGFQNAYYYLGNEPYVLDNNGVKLSASEYANRFLSYAVAIKNADPTAQTILNWHRYIAEKTDELHEIFQIAGNYIDVVDFHWYWQNGKTSFTEWRNQQGMKTSASSWDYTGGTYEEDAKAFKDTMAVWGYEGVKLASLEYNIGDGNSNQYPSESEISLMVGEMLLQFINGNVDIACLWPLHFPFKYYAEHNNSRTLFAENRSFNENALYDIFHFLKDIPEKKLLSSHSDNAWVYSLAVMDSVTREVELYLLNRADSPVNANLPLTSGLLAPGNSQLSSVIYYIEGDNYRSDTVIGAFNLSDGDVGVELPPFSITRITLPGIDSLYNRQSYNVEFKIVDEETGFPLPNCKLEFDRRILITDEQGIAKVNDINYGQYSLSLLATNYSPKIIKRIEILADSSFTYSMMEEKPEFSVLLKILDQSSGNPVNRAIINYKNERMITNSAGELSLPKVGLEKIEYSVEHSDYFTLSDSAWITGDTTLITRLTNKLADIRFELSDADGPLGNVSLLFDTYPLASDPFGLIYIFKRPAREEYSYSIQESGYKPVQDTFFLEKDTTISVVLEKLTGIVSNSSDYIKVYPNPASSSLYINIREGRAEVKLISMDGKVILSEDTNTNTTCINIAEIPIGCYYLKVNSMTFSGICKIMIIR